MRYREVRGGGCMLDFATDAVRGVLNLPEVAPTGTRSIVTFDVGAMAAIAPAVDRAVAAGAELVREAADTHFGQHQAALRDVEGNVFRLSAATRT